MSGLQYVHLWIANSHCAYASYSAHFERVCNTVDRDILNQSFGVQSMANRILSMVKSYIKTLKMDLAFVIEGQAPSELPEQVLGCVRLQFIDMDELNA